MTSEEFEQQALTWKLSAYGNVIRGDEDTSEDQVGCGVGSEIARRMVACWNACLGYSTHELEMYAYMMARQKHFKNE